VTMRRLLLFALGTLLIGTTPPTMSAQAPRPSTYAEMHWRSIGPPRAGRARALSGVADCYLMLGMSAAEAPDRCMPKAAEAALQALHLDDRLAETHASLAAVHNCFDWDLPGAERGYRSAIELDPSYATALHWLGMFLQATRGQLAEAVDSLEQAIELDPLSPPIIADLGLAHAFRGNFDAAGMYCRQALSLLVQNPQVVNPNLGLEGAMADLEALDVLRPRLQRLSRLAEKGSDTEVALGSDVMATALHGYGLLKLSGRDQGLEALRLSLGSRFVKKPRTTPEAKAA